MKPKQVILITGTTSGLGRGLFKHYYEQGCDLIAVNRRSDSIWEANYKNAQFCVLDISSATAVNDLLFSLSQENKFPSLFILNAGVNKPDNTSTAFALDIFQEVFSTNLIGTMTFIAAAKKLGHKNLTFIGISSLANIIPNPSHFAYYLSKWGIFKGFQLLQKNDPHNVYKSVVLGPVQTAILRNYGGPTGLQRKIFDFFSRSVEQTTQAIAAFAKGPRQVLYYPLGATLFYLAMKWPLKLLPSLYKGTPFSPALSKNTPSRGSAR